MPDVTSHHVFADPLRSGGPAYRDDAFGPAYRLAELQRAYGRTIDEVPDELIHAHARRIGRRVFGMIAAVGGAAMFVIALFQDLIGQALAGQGLVLLHSPTLVLGATWLLGVPAYFLARNLATQRVRDDLAAVASPSGDVHADIARLEGEGMHAARELIRRMQQKERSSIAWALGGLGLIGPLSLHLIIGVALFRCSLAQLDFWISLSAVMVGLAHVALVGFAVDFARQAAAVPVGVPLLEGTHWQKVFWVAAVSVLPGGLFVVPVIVTLVTGAVYAPLAYFWVARSVDRERAAISRCLDVLTVQRQR